MTRDRKKRRRLSAMSELSMTPLIDTALCLLIMFMVTTPMVHNAIRVNLPKGSLTLPQGKAKEGGAQAQELIVSVDKEGKISVNDQRVTMDTLQDAVKRQLVVLGNPHEISVWVRIDAQSSCNMLIGIIDSLKFVDGVKDVKVATTQRKGSHIA